MDCLLLQIEINDFEWLQHPTVGSDELVWVGTWCFFYPPLKLGLNLVHHVLQLIQELL